jgi:hypothetical protein
MMSGSATYYIRLSVFILPKVDSTSDSRACEVSQGRLSLTLEVDKVDDLETHIVRVINYFRCLPSICVEALLSFKLTAISQRNW